MDHEPCWAKQDAQCWWITGGTLDMLAVRDAHVEPSVSAICTDRQLFGWRQVVVPDTLERSANVFPAVWKVRGSASGEGFRVRQRATRIEHRAALAIAMEHTTSVRRRVRHRN